MLILNIGSVRVQNTSNSLPWELSQHGVEVVPVVGEERVDLVLHLRRDPPREGGEQLLALVQRERGVLEGRVEQFNGVVQDLGEVLRSGS